MTERHQGKADHGQLASDKGDQAVEGRARESVAVQADASMLVPNQLQAVTTLPKTARAIMPAAERARPSGNAG